MNDTPQSPLDSLKLLIEQCGSQRAAAARLEVSAQLVSEILAGNRDISAAVASALGWNRKIMYEQITKEPIVLDEKGHGDQFEKLYEKMDENTVYIQKRQE